MENLLLDKKIKLKNKTILSEQIRDANVIHKKEILSKFKKLNTLSKIGWETLTRPKIRATIPFLVLFVNNKCNGKCIICPIHKNEDYKSLNLDVIKRICKEAVELKTKIVAISGGEPLLHKNIFDIIHEFESHNIRVNLTSNGYLIDKDTALSLQRTNLTSICISLESSIPEINDAIRGEGSFNNVMRAFENLKKWTNTIKICIGITITKKNLITIPNIVDLANKIQVDSIRLQIVRNSFEQEGLSNENFHELKIMKENIEDLKYVLSYFRKKAIKNNIRVESKDYINDIYHSILGNRKTRCLAGESICAINYNGKISPCPNIKFNVSVKDGLKKAWNSMEFVNFRCTKKNCISRCSDSTYNNISCVVKRFVDLRWYGLIKDIHYYSI